MSYSGGADDRPSDPTTPTPASPASEGHFSPLDVDATQALIARMTEVLDSRSSACIERLHADSLHYNVAIELAKTEAESFRSELERQEEAQAAVRSELQDALERAETAELKLDVYERSRADVEADIQAQLGRMSAVHVVELSGQQVNRLRAEVQHLTVQATLAEETSEIAEREAMQHKSFRGLAAAVAEQKHCQLEETRRELEEARRQHETAQLQAAVELDAARQQAEMGMEQLRSRHTAHIRQLTEDFHSAAEAFESQSTTLERTQKRSAEQASSLRAAQLLLENLQKQHAEAQDEAAATQAQHAGQVIALQETMASLSSEHEELAAAKERQHHAATEALRAEHDRVVESIRAEAVAEQTAAEQTASQMVEQRRQHTEELATRLSAAAATHREEMEALRAELDKAHTLHGQQYEELHEATASLTADNAVLREQLRALQEMHDGEIARAEMLSVGHAERLRRESEAAAWQSTQMAEAHAEEMATKDTALREAQSAHSTAVRELQVATSELESLKKLMKTFLPDGEEVDSTEGAGKQYERLKLAYDALAVKFAQLQECATEDVEAGRVRDEEHKVALAQQSRLILRLQEQNEQHEADVLAANTELERLRAVLRDEPTTASDKQSAVAPAGGVRIKLSLVQRRNGFGMEVSDSLHVTRLIAGGSAQQAGVPVPSRIVEVAGQVVSTKQHLVQALTVASDRADVPFVFLTGGDTVGTTTAGSEEALTKLPRPAVDDILLLQESHAKELAELDASHKRAVAAAESQLSQTAKEYSAISDQFGKVQKAYEALQEEMMQSDATINTGESSSALRQAQQNLQEKEQLYNEAVADIALLRQNLSESEESLRRLQASHDKLEEEMLTMSAQTAIEATRLTESNAETSRRLETERKRHAAAELSLKQAHSGALAQHTERLRLLQVGYDQLDEDFLAASQSRQDAAEEVAQLKTKLAASLRQTKEMERSVAREKTARGRAESARLELQQSLEESVALGGLIEEQLAIERASVR